MTNAMQSAQSLRDALARPFRLVIGDSTDGTVLGFLTRRALKHYVRRHKVDRDKRGFYVYARGAGGTTWSMLSI